MDFHLEEDSLTLHEFKRLSLPKLTRAELVEFHCRCFPVNALSTANYLCINTLKVLNIAEYLYTEDHRVYQVNQLQRPYDVVPIFHNLTHLELHNRWDLAVQVLYQCPKLQNLKVYKELCDSKRYEVGDQENWMEPEFVPQCLLSSLRKFTSADYSDLQSELMLEQYILKNARILQTMIIRCMAEQPEMKRTLSMCPVASATCQITLDC
ncbi:F-box family protein [Trifolium medium]|uniref:F-box family protein n=1 Tax=Trifolium medium TaxID=97028 RepID=A0A392MB28_9FABA|nr:F-box family protein [Trifolium medium]